MKKMSVKEFVEQGFLQELNRQFLHPLGLALEVVIEDENVRFGEVWDCREDPEGLIFSDGVLDNQKARNVTELYSSKFENRLKNLGWIIQPLVNE